MGDFKDQEYFSINKLIFLVSKNWFWFLISLCLFFVISLLINRYSQEVYTNNTTLHIASEDNMYNPISQALGQSNSSFSYTNFTDEILFISSYPIIYSTVESLNFDIEYFIKGKLKTVETYNWKPITFVPNNLSEHYGLELTVEILNKKEFRLYNYEVDDNIFSFGDVIELGEGSFSILLSENYIQLNEDRPIIVVKWLGLHNATKKYKNKLEIDRLLKDASIIDVSISGENLDKETAFLNELSEIYINENLKLKNQATENTIEFIDNQLKETRDSLSAIESELLIFKKNNSLKSFDADAERFYDEISEFQKQKSKLLIEQKYFSYLKTYLDQNLNYNDLVIPSFYGINNDALNNLTSSLVEIQLERNSVDPKVNSINPLKQGLSDKINQLKRGIYESIETQKAVNLLVLEDIENRISLSESLLKNLPSLERELVNIERQYKLSESIYLFLMEKESEAGILGAGNVSDVRILEPAIVQKSNLVSPNSRQNYLIALLIGLIFPFIVLTIIDLLNNNVLSLKDVTNITSIPFIGLIGKKFSGFDLVVFEKPKSKLAETFRNVRSNIEFLIKKSDKGKSILITSSVSGEGKTFCAKNFAALYSMAGKKTVIIGADLRKPKMYLSFNHDNNKGLSNYLSGNAEISEILTPTKIDNLYFIPSGPIPPNPAELLESKEMILLIEELKLTFDYVLIDTPPICLVSDALILMDKVDLNIYVVRQNYTKKDFLNYVDDLYINKKIKNLSILLNDADFSIGYGYSYGYGRYNYSSYGKGYYDDHL